MRTRFSGEPKCVTYVLVGDRIITNAILRVKKPGCPLNFPSELLNQEGSILKSNRNQRIASRIAELTAFKDNQRS